jgi:dynein heavy chain
MLANASGNILEDEELINALAQSKTTSNAINVRMAEAETTTKAINETRELYRPVPQLLPQVPFRKIHIFNKSSS